MEAAMSDNRLFMVFDCESVGLHGETFAAGYVVIDGDGVELDAGRFACPETACKGDDAGRDGVRMNVPPFHETASESSRVRHDFWVKWHEWEAKGARLAADCCWPVEAR